MILQHPLRMRSYSNNLMARAGIIQSGSNISFNCVTFLSFCEYMFAGAVAERNHEKLSVYK